MGIRVKRACFIDHIEIRSILRYSNNKKVIMIGGTNIMMMRYLLQEIDYDCSRKTVFRGSSKKGRF